MALITCRDLALGYESHAILAHLSFSVNAGDYLCVVGENGSGKTTLMRTLLGLQKPLGGTIAFGDGMRQNEIGYLPQQTAIQRDFPATVWEIVLSGCQAGVVCGRSTRKAEKALAARTWSAWAWPDWRRCYRELSGGQQQRVLLARALCATQKLLLLDEPVAGLDPKVTAEMYALIERLNREGVTIIMISHDIAAAVRYATHILHMGEAASSERARSIESATGSRFMALEGAGERHDSNDQRVYLQFPLVRYALIVGVLIALCSSLLGVTLVLKRFSFIGDGLSHVAFGAMAIASVLRVSNNMLLVLPVTVLCAVLLLRPGGTRKIKGRRGHRDDLGGRACHRLSFDEPVLLLGKPLGRRVHHAVRLHLDPDALKDGGLAVRGAVVSWWRCLCSSITRFSPSPLTRILPGRRACGRKPTIC